MLRSIFIFFKDFVFDFLCCWILAVWFMWAKSLLCLEENLLQPVRMYLGFLSSWFVVSSSVWKEVLLSGFIFYLSILRV